MSLATLSPKANISAITPNSKAKHNLTLPATHHYFTSPLRLEVYGSPEHFTFEGFGFSYGGGARLTMVLKNHFTITTGLQYLKVDVTARSVKDSLNDLFPGYMDKLDVPLFLGYTLGNYRFSLTAQGGALFNIYSQAHGKMTMVSGFPSRMGFTGYLGLNFATHVGDRISVFAEPYLKCWFPPGDARLPPQLWSTGLSLGVRYNF